MLNNRRTMLEKEFAILGSYLSDSKLNGVLSAPETYKQQPLARFLEGLIGPPNGVARDVRDETFYNTKRAFQSVHHAGHAQWLQSAIDRASDVGNYENAASALAEIRALGTLIGAELSVTPLKESKSQATPDFKIGYGEEKAWVEVACKQLNREEAKALEEYSANPAKDRMGHWVHPAGRPKPGETVVENVASKIANIKPRARQAQHFRPAVLWLDLQEPDWWPIDSGHMVPVATWRGHFYVGSMWLAFFGWKGAPLLESHTHLRGGSEGVSRMRFPGFFKQNKEWSAAVISTSRTLAVYSNPYSKTVIPSAIMAQCTQLFRFQYEYSFMNWPSSQLFKRRLILEKCQLRTIARVCPFRFLG